MKVAVCLSGHVRNFVDCKESFINQIVNKYNPDIFVHTWDEYGYGRNGSPTNPINEETLTAIEKNKHLGLASNTEFLRGTPKVDFGILSDLNVKEIVIENYNDIEGEIIKIAEKVNVKWDIDYPPNFISSLRKIKLCNNLRKEYEKIYSIEYDIIIWARFDLIYYDFNIEKGTNLFHTPISQAYHDVSDIFSYSSPNLMNIFCTFYDCLSEYNEKNIHFNPHNLIMHHLESKNIPYVKDDKINLDILRR